MTAGQPSGPEAALFRASAVPTALVGALGGVAATVHSGVDGLVAAIAGTLLVIGFFAAGLLVSRRTARLAPLAVMAAALITYSLQIVGLGLVLVVFHDTTLFDPTLFGVTVLVAAAVWLAAQVRAFTRVPMLYVADPGPDGAERGGNRARRPDGVEGGT